MLLQAYPKLNWRDVKYILAKTATKAALDFDNNDNYIYLLNKTTYASQRSPSGYKWDEDWVTNDAGFNFSNYYGFGKLNVDKALAFAATYTTKFTKALVSSNQSATGLNLSIPDFSATGTSSAISFTQDLTIEAIQVTPTITHGNIGELAIELTSPRGLRSVVVPMNNSLDKVVNMPGYRFLTNAFYQESSLGNWTIKVVDGRTGNTGTLTGWKITVYGQVK